MGMSILARQDRVSLGNGMVLRLLSAGELIQARRRAHELARSPLEQPLCSNACLVALALEVEGEEQPFFRDVEEVLAALTAEEIEMLAQRWDDFRRETAPGAEVREMGFNPNFDERRFEGREESQR
jgi:hypothetical protein